MLKALAKGTDGRTVLAIGLSFANLDKFRQQPGDTFIRIEGAAHDMPFDVMIFSGESEAHLAQLIESLIGPETNVTISPKLRQ